jgi:hypothetical protein
LQRKRAGFAHGGGKTIAQLRPLGGEITGRQR